MTAWRISAWTHPEDPAGFQIKEHSIDVLRWRSNDPLDPRGRCSFTVPETYDWQTLIATQDPTLPTETSIIRLYRQGVDNTGIPDQEFKLIRFKKRITEDGEAVIDLFGIDWRLEGLDPAVLRWWDWEPGATLTRQSDWSFGGSDQRNLLKNLDFRSQGVSEKQSYHVHGGSGTYTLTVPSFGTTVGIAPYEAGGRASDVKAALEGIAGINEVTVTGKGHTQYDPLVVEFVDPQGNIGEMTIDETNLTNSGCAHPPCHTGKVTTIANGEFSVDPWTTAQNPKTGGTNQSLHGAYDTPSLSVVDDPFPATAGDQALRVDPATSGAGAQQIIEELEGGVTANATIEVLNETNTTDEFYLRVLDRNENLIAQVGPITPASTTAWETITIPEITLPDPLAGNELVYRIQIYSADGDSEPAVFLIRNPFIAEGLAAAYIGDITNRMLADAQTDHAPDLVRIPYVTAGAYTDTADSTTAPFPRKEHLLIRRGKHYGSQIIGSQFAELGYEYDLRPGAGAGAGETEPDAANWYLELYNEGNRGVTHSDFAFHVGYGVAGGLVAGRVPRATRWLGEGRDGLITEAVNSAQETESGVYEEFFSDGDITDLTTLQAKTQHFLDDDIANRMALTVELDDAAPTPYEQFDVGDRATFSYFGTMDSNERRVSEIVLEAEIRSGGELFWTPTVTASKLFSGDAATQEAVYRLLKEYKLLEKDKVGGGGAATAIAVPFNVIAASTAPEWMKQGARWVCDGVTDSQIINDALQEVLGAGGGTVYLTPGRFKIDMTGFAAGGPGINVPNTVKLQGAGRDATIIEMIDASTSGLTAPFIELGILSEIRDCYVTAYSTSGQGPTGVLMSGNGSAIRNSEIDCSFDCLAVDINGADLAKIIDSEITGPQSDTIDAIHIRELAVLCEIRNSQINNGRYHLRVFGSSFTPQELTIEGNRFTTSNLSGIVIEQALATSAGGFAFKIIDNRFDNQGFNAPAPVAESAIYIEGVSGTQIDNTSTEVGYGNLIEGNDFEAAFAHGIRLHNVTGATVRDNYLENNSGHGIWLSGDTDHCTVAENRLFISADGDGGNTWDMIHVDGNENLIHDNTTRDDEGAANKSRYAIAVDGNDNRIYDNDFRLTGQTGTATIAGTGNAIDIWADWTPTWTAVTTNPAIGAGTLDGRYVQRGKTVNATIRMLAAADTTFGTGAWQFDLPVAAAIAHDQAFGTAHIEDSGTGWEQAVAFYDQSAGVVSLIPAAGGAALVDDTTPIPWADGDLLTIEVEYEAA